MVFSSIAFLIAFLPLAVALERSMSKMIAKNVVLIAASLVFYAYGEPTYVALLLASSVMNYVLGLLVAPGREGRRAWIVVAVAANLGMLAVFKYADMAIGTLNTLFGADLPLPHIPLPLGISFYTFQALSYVIDVYRDDVAPQRNLAWLTLYISFFPQLVAGPIVKYHDFGPQIYRRRASLEDTAQGMRRFACGLAKKVLLANTMAVCADRLYALDQGLLSAHAAWLAAAAYLLEIYLDFSAYSDMATGLGRIFGLTFPEHFEHPYSSTSMREFWRRWHISLSTWFLRYLYIPLGGNRLGRRRTAINRAIVFFCCGLWHGASWTFVVWGLLHGAALLFEEYVDVRRLPRAVAHVVVVLFVGLTFVVFRADTIAQAAGHIRAMLLGWNPTNAQLVPVMSCLTPPFLIAAAVGTLISGSLPERAARLASHSRYFVVFDGLCYAASLVLLVTSMVALAGGTYNPFIYFRF